MLSICAFCKILLETSKMKLHNHRYLCLMKIDFFLNLWFHSRVIFYNWIKLFLKELSYSYLLLVSGYLLCTKTEELLTVRTVTS